MSEINRRSNDRCPFCQGPGQPNDKYADGVKCRNSLCTHNHTGNSCPRCKATDLESVAYKNGVFTYTCADCQNNWAAKLEG